MSQEIEIEFKTLLKKETFIRLHNALPFPQKGRTQTNYYFETKNFDLKSNRCALRIREKNGVYTLTLKQPNPKGILETHDELTEEEFHQWINMKPVRKDNTGRQLEQMHISISNMHYYGFLKTERFSYEEDGIIYVLDKSYYNDIIDYELEIEVTEFDLGEKVFTNLINTFHIPKQSPISKIERFFNTLE